MTSFKPLFSTLILSILITSSSQAVIRYVNKSATGTGDGLTWENAYVDVQSALAASSSGDEIWVAKGTYKVSTDFDRSSTFNLKSGVTLYGGFSGGETNKDIRDFTSGQNATTLSGNTSSSSSFLFAYHTITADGVDATAIVDGFVITGGNADGTDMDRFGGALRINNASPTIRNCWILGSSTDGGAGAHVGAGSNPTFEDCTFRFCNALAFDSIGGALLVDGASSATVARCKFDSNQAEFGGGIYCAADSTVMASACVFEKNGASKDGGAIYYAGGTGKIENSAFEGSGGYLISGAVIYIAGGSLEIVRNTFTRNGGGFIDEGGAIYISGAATPRIYSNCFWGNQASKGGAIYSENSSPVLVNNVFVGNLATDGAAFYTSGGNPEFVNNSLSQNIASGSGGGIYSATGEGSFHNLILWANEAPTGAQVFDNSLSITASYSNIQDGYEPGTSIISANPKFIDDPIPGGDGVWATMDDDYGDLRLRAIYEEGAGDASPSIDVGNNELVPNDLPNLDSDETTEEPTPVDKLDQHRFQNVSLVADLGVGTPFVVDHGAYETRETHIVYVCPPPDGTPPSPPAGSSGEATVGVGLLHSPGLVASGHPVGAGDSWENPLYDLYKALEIVQSGGEARVRNGTFFLRSDTSGDTEPLTVPDGSSLNGGYVGEGDLKDGETTISGRTTDPDFFVFRAFYQKGGDNGVTIRDFVFRDYRSEFESGAVVKNDGAKMTFQHVIWTNIAGSSAYYGTGDHSSEFINNTWTDNEAGNIEVDNAFNTDNDPTLIISASTMEAEGDNTAFGVRATGVRVDVKDSSFTGFEAGAITALNSRQISVTDSEFRNNKSTGPGAGIFASAAAIEPEGNGVGWFKLESAIFTDNEAANGGGAIHFDGNAEINTVPPKVDVNVSIFDANIAAASGGHIDGHNAEIDISDTKFSNGTALSGGGISLTSCRGEMSDVIFDSNTVAGFFAGAGGGARLNFGGPFNLQRVVFINNYSSQPGTALVASQTDIDMIHVVVAGNSGGGAAIQSFLGDVSINACTITRNESSTIAGGLNFQDGNLTVINSIVSGNSANPNNIQKPPEKDIFTLSATTTGHNNAFEFPPPEFLTTNTKTGADALLDRLPPVGESLSLESLPEVLGPSIGSVLSDCGNPETAPDIDILGRTHSGPPPIGAYASRQIEEEPNGINDPPTIDIDETRFNSAFFNGINLPVIVGDPDYQENGANGKLKLTLQSDHGRFLVISAASADTGTLLEGAGALVVLENTAGAFNSFAKTFIPTDHSVGEYVITITLSDQGYSNNGVKEETPKEVIKVIAIVKTGEVARVAWVFETTPEIRDLPEENQAQFWGSDSSGNGKSNALEFARGTDPEMPESGGSTDIEVQIGLPEGDTLAEPDPTPSTGFRIQVNLEDGSNPEDGTYLFFRRNKTGGIAASIEATVDMETWAFLLDPFNLSVDHQIIEEGATYEIVAVPFSQLGLSPSNTHFFRIAVELPQL